MSRKLFCFDFDRTLVQGSTHIQLGKLCPGGKIPSEIANKGGMGQYYWVEQANALFKYVLHDLGHPLEALKDCIRETKFIPGMKELLVALYKRGNDVIVVSDGYDLFIQWILEEHGLTDHIQAYFAYPLTVGDDGTLSCKPFTHQTHCKLSPIHMCKGDVMNKFIEEKRSEGTIYSSIVFAGDGSNDLCPALSLEKNSFVFAKSGTLLHQYITDLCFQVQATVHSWEDGFEFLEKLDMSV